MENTTEETMNYTHEVSISFDEIAKNLVTEQEMVTVTRFLRSLVDELDVKAQAEEENSLPLVEDIFYKALAHGISEAITKAQNALKEQTRLRIHHPSQEEVHAKIKDLLQKRQERLEREAALEEKREREGMNDGERVYWMMFEQTPVASMAFDNEEGVNCVTFTFKNGTTERRKLTNIQYKNLLNAWSLWNENRNWQKLQESSASTLEKIEKAWK